MTRMLNILTKTGPRIIASRLSLFRRSVSTDLKQDLPESLRRLIQKPEESSSIHSLWLTIPPLCNWQCYLA